MLVLQKGIPRLVQLLSRVIKLLEQNLVILGLVEPVFVELLPKLLQSCLGR